MDTTPALRQNQDVRSNPLAGRLPSRGAVGDQFGVLAPEAFRDVVWVLIEELHVDGWHMGGKPFEGPKSLMEQLGRAKTTYESIDGNPMTRQEFASVAPPLVHDGVESIR